MTRQNLLTKTFQLFLLATLVALTTALGLGLIPPPHLRWGPEARAAGTIDVTTTMDEYNTSGNGSGCSLREAIESINTGSSFGGCNNPGNAADTIQLQAMTYTLSIPYPTTIPPTIDSNAIGDLNLKQSMTIRGAGSTQTIVEADNGLNDGVLHILPCCSVGYAIKIEGIAVRGGKSSTYSAGGIFVLLPTVNSSFILDDVVIEENKITNNINGGGGLHCTAVPMFHLNNVTIRNNQALSANGGGLFIEGCNTILTNVTINGNEAGASGGGIYFTNYGNDSTLQMTNVTIYGNLAQTSGGGLYLNYPGFRSITSVITNVTFANNQTIGVGSNGGNIYNNATTLSLKNTLIADGLANGSPNNCAGNPLPNITSLGYNLDSGNTCGLTATGDITNTNPLLASALADNGGSTQTLALLAGSPAIDAGTCSGAPAIDQRGVVRPQGAICDIGAYEAYPYPNLVLTKTVDDTTPTPGQRITYTVAVQNNGSISATNTLISDTLPISLSLAGPVRLDPPGTTFTPTLPTLVSGLTLSSGQTISLTFPVTVSQGVAGGTVITNTAAVTSTEVVTPQVDSVGITIPAQTEETEETYLPLILKN